MGYRSQVGVVVKTEPFEKALEQEEEGLRCLVKELLDAADDTEDEDEWRLYYWVDIKWYDDTYPACSWVTRYVEQHPNESHLLRLGEGPADVDDKGHPDDCPFNLCWERNVTW